MTAAENTAPNQENIENPEGTSKEEALLDAIEQSKADAEQENGTSQADDQATEIARLQEEVNKYKDQWIRAVADAENTRKRAQRDLEESSRYAVTNFARDIADVLENLIRASSSIPAESREENELLKTLGEGVDLTLQEMIKALEKHHISRIHPIDEKFDHNFHQAVVQIERTDVPEGTIVQVIQAGYMLHDRLLRPAMVAVSKQPQNPTKVDTTA